MLLPPRVPYLTCTDTASAVTAVAALAPRTVIIDVEPLIASWNTDRDTLDAGLAAFLDIAASLGGLHCEEIVFATNAWRRPSALTARGAARLDYVAHAGKPVRVERFRGLAGPGVVVGDQIATDGVLARRLGYTFVHYVPGGLSRPPGTQLMHAFGRPLRHLLFRG